MLWKNFDGTFPAGRQTPENRPAAHLSRRARGLETLPPGGYTKKCHTLLCRSLESEKRMNSVRETAVGIFVLLGLICVAYLAIKLGRMEFFANQGFELSARFDSASGLRVGADVELAGVPVGRVVAISLDPDPLRTQAVVHLRLDKNLHLSDDSIASIKTSGLIGDKYVSLSRGGSEKMLPPGGTITETESPVDLETLIGKYAFGGV